jgi:putative thiamine transport system substrate-binding protein
VAAHQCYLAWAGVELQMQFGVTLQHVKVTDTADNNALQRKAAERNTDGSVDGSMARTSSL